MKKSLGSILRSGRERKGLTRDQVAKKGKLSSGYLGLLEIDYPVAFSPDLHTRLGKVLGVKVPAALIEKHQRAARKLGKEIRARYAKKATKKKAAKKSGLKALKARSKKKTARK